MVVNINTTSSTIGYTLKITSVQVNRSLKDRLIKDPSKKCHQPLVQ